MLGALIGGRYRVLRRLGAGGMGEVWAAHRVTIGDEVALKRLRPDRDTPGSRARFAIEAQAAAHIRHPNVVPIFDYDEDPAHGPFLVMELVPGHTLADEVAAGRLPEARALWALAQACAAVEAGHRRGIVHRDLKPGNVLVARSDDGAERVKVADFGLALDVGGGLGGGLPGGGDRALTAPGAVVGTAAYLAPELTEGRPATPASDVWALGVILYELVTGRLPFDGATPWEVMLAISGGRHRPAGELVPGLSAAVRAAIDAALVRDPDRRPASPEALARLATGGRAPLAPGVAPVIADGAAAARPATAVTRDTDDAQPRFGRFVGRAAELARLQDEWAEASAGRGRIVLVSGEPGVGTSRLVERFAVWAGELGAAVVAARLPDPGVGGAPRPPLDAIAALVPAAAPREVGAGELDRWRVFAAITDALAGQAAGRPLLITLDQLHAATPLELDLVAHLHRALGPHGALIVATAHAHAASLAAWRAARGAAITELALGPFDDETVRAWLDAAFGALDAPPSAVRRLARACGGNAYALGELVRDLVTRGALRRRGDGWWLDPDVALELPDGVAALWRARLAALPEAHRRVLDIAAVLGDEVAFEVLAAAAGVDDATLDAAIDGAFARRLLTERGVSPGHDARFTSAPVRQVLLDDQSPRARRRAHLAAIAALRQFVGEARAAHALVHHLHAIGDAPGAVRAAAVALAAPGGRDPAAVHAAVAAATEARRAADPAALAVADLAIIDRHAGALALADGRLDDADAALGLAIAAASDDPALAAVALDARLDRARVALARGDHDGALAAAEAVARDAAAAGDRGRAVAARAVEVEVAVRDGRDPARLDAVVADLGDRDPPALRSRVHRARAWARLKRGDWAGAAADAQRAHALARVAGDLAAQQLAVAALSAIRNESGDPVGAVETARESLTLARRLGERRREAICMANLADTLIGAGQVGEALDLLRGALAEFLAIGDEACEGDCRVNLGRALLAVGRGAEAEASLARGAALCSATGRREFEGVAWLYLGDARLAADAAAARAAYARASALLGEMGSHQAWRAALGEARAARACGDAAAARAAAARAVQLIDEARARLEPGRDAAALARAMDEALALGA